MYKSCYVLNYDYKNELCIYNITVPEEWSLNPTASELMQGARALVVAGLRPNTQRAYTCAQKQFLNFCMHYDRIQIPCDENTILMYISYLSNVKRLKCQSIKVYLSAVRALHVLGGVKYCLEGNPAIKLALKAVERQAPGVNKKLAITYDILIIFHGLLSKDYDHTMMWAAMTLAHFGCLRTAEFVSKNEANFEKASQLLEGDISFCTLNQGERGLCVHIKSSKTDSTGKGLNALIGCTRTHVCAVCAMTDYLGSLGSHQFDRPLFRWYNGMYLTRAAFVKETKRLVKAIGLDSTKYSGHSYRSGGATSGALAGFSAIELKLLGRWSSNAFEGYLRTPPQVLLGFARRMART